MISEDGWTYRGSPTEGDARKLVTLEQDGMIWIGIRAFDHTSCRWLNNNEPEHARVKAWRDLPDIARGFWDGGTLTIIPRRIP